MRESEEACSTAAVPVTAVVRLNTPIQSISLHSSFAHPSIHTIKAAGREGWRERSCDRESIRRCRKQRGGEQRRRRERVYQCCWRRAKSYRERAGKKVRLSPFATFTLCHINKVCVRLHLILSLSHTHTNIQPWCCRDML